MLYWGDVWPGLGLCVSVCVCVYVCCSVSIIEPSQGPCGHLKPHW